MKLKVSLGAWQGLATLLAAATTLSGAVTDWPGWRGDGTGIARESSLPLRWSATENIRWSTTIAGYGWSCPIVTGNKIFVTTAITDRQQAPSRKGPGGGEEAPDAVFRWEVHCLDRVTGKLLWKQIAAEHKPRTGNHISNTYASETPVTDGERIYAYFGMVGVFCYDLTGCLLWQRDLGAYRTFANWGSSSSPALDNGRLFILCDNEQNSFLAALDARSGEELWRVRREERSTWSSPIVWRNKVRTELVVMGSNFNRGYDPVTGKELWRCASERSVGSPAGNPGGGGPPPGGKSKGGSAGKGSGGKSASGGCKASPVAGKDLLFVGMSSKTPGQELGPLWAIRAGASSNISLQNGEKSNSGVAWFRDDAGPHFTSALLYEGRLYVFPAHDRGKLSCFDAQTGATIYQQPLPGAAGFKASPCVFNDKIFCTDENGLSFIIEAGSQFKLLGSNALEELTWASPALVEGALFLRTVNHIFCISTNK